MGVRRCKKGQELGGAREGHAMVLFLKREMNCSFY